MIKKIISFFLKSLGYEVRRLSDDAPYSEMSPGFKEAFKKYSPYTMTSRERMHALYESARYVVGAHIPGVFVETGVWKGGSAMIASSAFKEFGDSLRDIYLYDTFDGMPAPSERDVVISGNISARILWEKLKNNKETERWMCYASLEEVKANILKTGYPQERFVFIKGMVEDTIPRELPERIAILRIDTDWYESTYHVLKHLFPRLSRGGVLILDDYGYWRGAQEAADQYFKEEGISIFLHAIDNTGRIGIKI